MEKIEEYLTLLKNEGNIEVDVKFKDQKIWISNRKITANNIIDLINPTSDNFYTKMTFDEHLYEVYKYEIDPIRMKLTIKVRKAKA